MREPSHSLELWELLSGCPPEVQDLLDGGRRRCHEVAVHDHRGQLLAGRHRSCRRVVQVLQLHGEAEVQLQTGTGLWLGGLLGLVSLVARSPRVPGHLRHQQRPDVGPLLVRQKAELTEAPVPGVQHGRQEMAVGHDVLALHAGQQVLLQLSKKKAKNMWMNRFIEREYWATLEYACRL